VIDFSFGYFDSVASSYHLEVHPDKGGLSTFFRVKLMLGNFLKFDSTRISSSDIAAIGGKPAGRFFIGQNGRLFLLFQKAKSVITNPYPKKGVYKNNTCLGNSQNK